MWKRGCIFTSDQAYSVPPMVALFVIFFHFQGGWAGANPNTPLSVCILGWLYTTKIQRSSRSVHLIILLLCFIFAFSKFSPALPCQCTVRREGAIWHHLGCQSLVQKTTPLMVPIGTLWGCRVAPSQEGATMAPLEGAIRGCHHGTLARRCHVAPWYTRCQKAPFSVWYLATFTCAIIINKEPTEAVDGDGGVTSLWSCFSLGIVCMGVCLCALGDILGHVSLQTTNTTMNNDCVTN